MFLTLLTCLTQIMAIFIHMQTASSSNLSFHLYCLSRFSSLFLSITSFLFKLPCVLPLVLHQFLSVFLICLSPSFSLACLVKLYYNCWLYRRTCSSVTRVVACKKPSTFESVCDLHDFAKEILSYIMLCGSMCFDKEILAHVTLIQPPYLVCGFLCFIGNFWTRDVRNARTSTTNQCGARSGLPQ